MQKVTWWLAVTALLISFLSVGSVAWTNSVTQDLYREHNQYHRNLEISRGNEACLEGYSSDVLIICH